MVTGLLLATLLSAAYQRSPAHVRFTIAEFHPALVAVSRVSFDPMRNLPHEVRIADRRTAADELDDLAADLEARLEGSGPSEGSAQPETVLSSSPGCTGGTKCWPRATTAGRARPSAAPWSGWPTRVRTLASTWWAWGRRLRQPPKRRPAPGGAWDSSACARCSACLSPAESDALLGVSAAASLDDDRALYRDTEWPVEQVEKFKPYSTASLYGLRPGAIPEHEAGKRSPA